MSDIANMDFKRLFSLTMYRNKKLHMGEMSFFKDFAGDKRGDLYPVLEKCGECSEKIEAPIYKFSSEDGHLVRMLGAYFPYATYEAVTDSLAGQCGFSFIGSGKRADILFEVKEGIIVCTCKRESFSSELEYISGTSFCVTCRGGSFDIYINNRYVHSFAVSDFDDSVYCEKFKDIKAGVYLSGEAALSKVEFYMDCGISQADMRPVKYENGEIMTEGGKVYLTMSVRMQEKGYQGVFSWVPGTAEFSLCGALFFDAGDGMWANDVASSIVYHRGEKLWYLWVCSFSHGHILGHAKAAGDVRFGINVIDITLMDKMGEADSDCVFLGKQGDEDPDFVYNEETGKWLMTVCRIVEENGGRNYRYFLFESDRPFDGYKYVANARSGAETGGSIVRTDSGLYFVCGSGFDKRAQYHIYCLPDMNTYKLIKCDYDDGGFRGWGTVMPVKAGSRTKYYWLTFDRHLGSTYNWSYGNIYCFLAD